MSTLDAATAVAALLAEAAALASLPARAQCGRCRSVQQQQQQLARHHTAPQPVMVEQPVLIEEEKAPYHGACWQPGTVVYHPPPWGEVYMAYQGPAAVLQPVVRLQPSMVMPRAQQQQLGRRPAGGPGAGPANWHRQQRYSRVLLAKQARARRRRQLWRPADARRRLLQRPLDWQWPRVRVRAAATQRGGGAGSTWCRGRTAGCTRHSVPAAAPAALGWR
jgi:hypothetical protein